MSIPSFSKADPEERQAGSLLDTFFDSLPSASAVVSTFAGTRTSRSSTTSVGVVGAVAGGEGAKNNSAGSSGATTTSGSNSSASTTGNTVAATAKVSASPTNTTSTTPSTSNTNLTEQQPTVASSLSQQSVGGDLRASVSSPLAAPATRTKSGDKIASPKIPNLLAVVQSIPEQEVGLVELSRESQSRSSQQNVSTNVGEQKPGKQIGEPIRSEGTAVLEVTSTKANPLPPPTLLDLARQTGGIFSPATILAEPKVVDENTNISTTSTTTTIQLGLENNKNNEMRIASRTPTGSKTRSSGSPAKSPEARVKPRTSGHHSDNRKSFEPDDGAPARDSSTRDSRARELASTASGAASTAAGGRGGLNLIALQAGSGNMPKSGPPSRLPQDSSGSSSTSGNPPPARVSTSSTTSGGRRNKTPVSEARSKDRVSTKEMYAAADAKAIRELYQKRIETFEAGSKHDYSRSPKVREN
ncbi:unnamed protein product [Amoebophrya sp. A25]|nr:unnamed protein product [Amoebophrya sp. A25]|eukprot:GSA25T00007181001.1